MDVFHKAYRLLRLLSAPLRREWVFFLYMYIVFVASRLLEQPGAHVPPYIFYLENACDLYIVCALLCAIPARARKWVRLAFYVIGYVAAFAEGFIHERFHLLFGPITIQLVSETTSGEASEFFASYLRGSALWKLVAIYAPIVALNIATGAFSRRIERAVSGITPKLIRIAANSLAPAAMAVCFALTAGEKAKMAEFFMSRNTDEAEHADSHAFHTPLYRIVFSTKFLSLSGKELDKMRDNMRHIEIDSCAHTVKNIVLYIGESYNKHHSQLYGYRLATTPLQERMAGRGELIAMTDAVTPWNVTSNVFKDALSTHSTDQPGSWTDGVLLPGVMKKAGYKVAFISSQYYKSPNLGVVDFNGSFFLNDGKIERQCFDYRNKFRKSYDLTLLKEIDKFKPGKYNFVIFHGMGQHQEYCKRFTPKDAHFKAQTDYAWRSDLSVYEKQTVADYDNATLYNDRVVAALCDRFRREDAVVVYMPDHGEEVYDRIHSYGRDHNAHISPEIAWAEFQVPLEIWFSPTARRLHPGIYAAARRAADKPFSTDDLPHLIMGLAGIKASIYSPTRDLLSPTFNASRRRLLKGTIDYDSLMLGDKPKKGGEAWKP